MLFSLRRYSVAVAAVFFSFAPFSVFSLPADFDTGFNATGLVTESSATMYRAAAIQDDGSIVAVGYVFNTSFSAFIGRYTASGVLDTSFSTDGFDSPTDGQAYDVVIQPDGKILVLIDNADITVARYLSDGTLDPTFGSNGVAQYDFAVDYRQESSEKNDQVRGMVLQPDGKIVIAGHYYNIHQNIGTTRSRILLRLHGDGSIDTGFGGGDGYRDSFVCSWYTDVHAVAVRPNGEIVVSGVCSDVLSGSIVRDPFYEVFSTDGATQAHYFTDNNGNSDTSNPDIPNDGGFHSIAVQPDGDLLLAGKLDTAAYVFRFNDLTVPRADQYDDSFDSDGIQSYAIGGAFPISDVLVQPDNKVVVSSHDNNYNSVIYRLNADGGFDSSFGSNGIRTFSGTVVKSIMLQPDGAIVFTGHTPPTQLAIVGRLEGDVMDTSADAVSFTDQTSVAADSVVTSSIATVSGLGFGISVPASVQTGEFAINGSTTYQGGYAYVQNGDQLNVRHTSASAGSSSVDTEVFIGGVLPHNRLFGVASTRDTFTSTTGTVADTTPDAFTFTDQVDVSLSSTVISGSITVSGIDSATAVSVTGGEYSINGSGYTNTAGTVNDGDSVMVRHISAGTLSTSVDTVLTIGGVSDTFSSTTLASVTDTTPDSFSFTSVGDVATSELITSNSITISGINAPAAVTILGGEYSINGAAFTSTAGTCVNGDAIQVRVTSSASEGVPVSAQLTVGGVAAAFTATTQTSTGGTGSSGGSGEGQAGSSGGGGTLSLSFLLIVLTIYGFHFTVNLITRPMPDR